MSLIACGFYTPDYAHWWHALRPSLERHGVAHDFVEAEKLGGGWEHNTMAKPYHLRDAMRRHPDKVVVFLDVDCKVHAPLEPLTQVHGDVAFRIRTKRKKNYVKWGNILSGTLVLRPTDHARKFVEVWIAQDGEFGDVDQSMLMLAICNTPGCSFEPLPTTYCALPGDKVDNPAILHDSASANIDKIGTLAKRLHRMGAPHWIIKAMPPLRTHV